MAEMDPLPDVAEGLINPQEEYAPDVHMMEIDDHLLDIPDSDSSEDLVGPPLPPLYPQPAQLQPPLIPIPVHPPPVQPPPVQPLPVQPPPPPPQQEQQQIDNLCAAVNNCDIQVEHVAQHNAQSVERFAIVLADFSCGETVFEYQGVQIRWVKQVNSSIVETTAAVARFFDEQTPKLLVLSCYSQYLDVLPISVIMDHLRMIIHKSERNPIHSLCISSMPFKPSQEAFWLSILEINSFIKNSNLSLNQCPLSLHRASLNHVPKINALGVNGAMWKEKVEGYDLGSTLSTAGVKKHKQWISRHIVHGLRNSIGFSVSSEKDVLPIKLQDTPGFKLPKFKAMIKRLGTFEDRPLQDIKQKNRRLPKQRQPYQRQRQRQQYGQDLRPKLQSIVKRRNSRAMSSVSTASSSGCSSASSAASCHTQDRIQELEKQLDNLRSESLLREEKYIKRVDLLNVELDNQNQHRRAAENKVFQIEEDYRFMKETNTRLRDFKDEWKQARQELQDLQAKKNERNQ